MPATARPPLSRRKRAAFTAIAVVLVACVVEAVLQLATLASPTARALLTGEAPAAQVADPALGWRGSPGLADHDSRGFRNEQALDSAAVVALGDSQTYGTGVAREDAWPQQLERITGATTYSMAFGGWGPAHGFLLLPDALALRPTCVVQAFYFGNDLPDSWSLVHERGQLRGLATTDAAELELMRQAEGRDPFAARAEALFRTWDHAPSGVGPRLRFFLSRHVRTYGLLRAVKNLVRHGSAGPAPGTWETALAAAQASPESLLAVEAGGLRTILTPRYRLLALDRSDPRVREGFRIALEALRREHVACREKGVGFAVLLVPTKERVVHALLREPRADVASLVAAEESAMTETLAFLDAHGIPRVDGFASLRAVALWGANPHPESTDGHPNARGQRALAEAVAREAASCLGRSAIPGLP